MISRLDEARRSCVYACPLIEPLGPLGLDGITVVILVDVITHFLAGSGRGLDLPLSH